LRFLRYLRFWSLFGAEKPDSDILACFSAIKDLLQKVSYNRLYKEMQKITLLPRRGEIKELLIQNSLAPFLSKVGAVGQTFFNSSCINLEGENS